MRSTPSHFIQPRPDRHASAHPTRRALVGVAGVTALVGGGLTAVSVSATAATASCQVSYSVTNSWPGGFQAGITITNGSSPITSWTLAFAFPGDQQVSSGWSGTWTQSGQNVTVKDAGWNGSLGTGASTSIGFTATFTGTNTDPGAFTLNGAACNGGPTPSASATSSTPSPSGTPSPSASPSGSASPSPSASSSSPPPSGQPSVPGTCKSLGATLSTSNELFSSSAESAPPDTSRIQSALNSCAGTGKAVELTASGGNTAFLSRPLSIGGNEVLLVDAGVTLYASRNPADYQISGKSTCGTITSSDNGCNPFITLSGSGAGIMGTRSASGSQGIIDGRGGQDMLNTSETWWQLAAAAKSGGGSQNNPKLVQSNGASTLTLYDIDLINSPMYHVLFKGGSGMTVWGIRIKTPSNSRNTDGVDPQDATNVLVNDSYIQDGDDCIAVKSDPGTAASHITVENTHCWGTHGLSIGSQTAGGVNNVTFLDDTLAGTDTGGITSTSNNGIRVKSDSSAGGTVSQVLYQNICMTGVKDLIVMDPNYSSGNGSAIPNFADITLNGVVSVSSASSATSKLDGYDASHPLGLKLENIKLDATSTTAQYANIGLYNSNITASGTDVSVKNISGSGSIPSCSFPSFPAL